MLFIPFYLLMINPYRILISRASVDPLASILFRISRDNTVIFGSRPARGAWARRRRARFSPLSPGSVALPFIIEAGVSLCFTARSLRRPLAVVWPPLLLIAASWRPLVVCVGEAAVQMFPPHPNIPLPQSRRRRRRRRCPQPPGAVVVGGTASPPPQPPRRIGRSVAADATSPEFGRRLSRDSSISAGQEAAH